MISRSRTRRDSFRDHTSSTWRRTARLPNHASSRLAAHLHLASRTARCSHASRWSARTAKNGMSRRRGGRILAAVGGPLVGVLCESLEQEGYGEPFPVVADPTPRSFAFMRPLSYCFVIFFPSRAGRVIFFRLMKSRQRSSNPQTRARARRSYPQKKAPTAVPRSATDRGGELAPEGPRGLHQSARHALLRRLRGQRDLRAVGHGHCNG